MNKVMMQLLIFGVFLLILTGCGNTNAQEDEIEETNLSEDKKENDSVVQSKQEEKDENERDRKEKEAQKRNDEENKHDKSTTKDIEINDGSKGNKDKKDFNESEATDGDLEIAQDDEETKDKDLNLGDMHGTATVGGDGIIYDEGEGYHVLHLQTGLSSYASSTTLKGKWVAFSLPNGVSVPDVDEVPSAVVIVSLPCQMAILESQ